MLATALKIAISIAFLVALFHQVPLHELKPYFDKMRIGYFFLALSVVFTGNFLAAIRWFLIMRNLNYPAKLGFYLKQSLIGVMFNQVLPTSIGGDAYKIVALHKLKSGKRMASLAVLIDRLYGLTGLILISAFTRPLAHEIMPKAIFIAIFSVNLAFCFGFAVLLSLSLLKISFQHFSLKIISDFAHHFYHSVSSKCDFLLKAVLALLPNLLTISAFSLLATTQNISLGFASFAIIIPSLLLLSMLPISLGGWGLREGAMVFLGGLIGLGKAEALAIALLFGFATLLTSIPGLCLYLLQTHSRGISPRSTSS